MLLVWILVDSVKQPARSPCVFRSIASQIMDPFIGDRTTKVVRKLLVHQDLNVKYER